MFLKFVLRNSASLFVAIFAVAAHAEDYAVRTVGEGFTAPTVIVSAFDGTGRLFIGEHGGTIRSLDADGTVSLFLDISARVFPRVDFCCNEQGLLGLTFPPGDGFGVLGPLVTPTSR